METKITFPESNTSSASVDTANAGAAAGAATAATQGDDNATLSQLELANTQFISNHDNDASDDTTALLEEYRTFLMRQRQRLSPLPDVSMTYYGLSHCIKREEAETDVSNIAKSAWNTVKWVTPLYWPIALRNHWQQRKHSNRKQAWFYTLRNCSGSVNAGTMTLIIAPPGNGKTMLMKALAGRLNDANLCGDIRYSGKKKGELEATLERLLTYVEQCDSHLPRLTVRETLEFAMDTQISNLTYRPGHEFQDRKERLEMFLKVLGLEECADTQVGDEATKGISGGQRRRLTVGEALVSNTRVLLLDQITSGLDSAVAYQIVSSIRIWCKELNGTVVSSLLQPPPDIFNLFDDILLLREGQILFHGSRDSLFNYLHTLGLRRTESEDEAHFLTRFVTDPENIRREQNVDSGAVWDTNFLLSRWNQYQHGNADSALRQEHENSRFESANERSYDEEVYVASQQDEGQVKPFVNAQYRGQYPHSIFALTKLCAERQMKLTRRNVSLISFRMFRAVTISLVLGSLFWDLDNDEFDLKLGLITFMAIFAAFGNLAEIPESIKQRRTVQKQIATKFYPTTSYTLSTFLLHVPIAAAETLTLGSIVYWMTGFAAEVDRFMFFLLVLVVANFVFNAQFKVVSYPSISMEQAETQGGPIIGVMMAVGGFLVPRKEIPMGLRWLYWISPFSWVTTSLYQNELRSSDFNEIVEGTDTSLGTLGLELFEVPTDDYLKWMAILVLAVIFTLLTIVTTLLLRYIRIETDRGSLQVSEVNIESNIQGTSNVSKKTRFKPWVLAFKNVWYSVDLPSGETVTILRGVTGVAKPGRLTGLMGVSGSGKTTLMDVLVGRKTVGAISGDVRINGHSKEGKIIKRGIGYVEQFDLHMPYATVYESLRYAAELRLPESFSAAERDEFTEEILKLMELDSLRHRLVGHEGSQGSSLSPGERKRLTIGVELVANPPIIFLDEPTTGLDSRAALSVMRVIRRIVNTGRTVICSVHQSSRELFSLFDDVILLQRGGHQVYAGPLGENGYSLIEFFSSIGAGRPSIQINPAEWVLDILHKHAELDDMGKNTNILPEAIDFAEKYKNSTVKETNDKIVENSCEASEGNPLREFTTTFARSYGAQLAATLHREFRSYWRNTSYNWARILMLILVSIFLGAVFYDIEGTTDDESGVLSLASVIFVAISFGSVTNFLNVLPVMVNEKPVYSRETGSNTYPSSVYSLSLTIVEIPYSLVIALTFGSIYYVMAGFSMDLEVYWHSVLCQFLVILTMTYVGMLFVSLFVNVEAAHALGFFYFMICFLFGGIFIEEPSIPAGWMWVYYLNPIAYATNVMSSLQLHCESDDCPTITIQDLERGELEVHRCNYAEEEFGFDFDDRWSFTGYMILLLIGIRLLGILALNRFSQVKR